MKKSVKLKSIVLLFGKNGFLRIPELGKRDLFIKFCRKLNISIKYIENETI